MIEATAPGRCGLVGNPTDMYGGSVISCSTKERARCVLDPDSHVMAIEVSGERQIIANPEDLTLKGDRLDVVRAVISALEIVPGKAPPFQLTATTDIPMQAGLAGSTAMIATIVGCFLAYLQLRPNRYQIAEMIRSIEYETLGIICGFQDQYMTTFGGLNYMDFRGKNSSESRDLEPYATVEPLQPYVSSLPLLLAHTGVRHNSGSVHKSLRERWLEGEAEVVSGYLRVANQARLAKKALLSSDWELISSLMNENHAIVRDLGGSGDANEALIRTALGAGATAAKLAGAGGGGTILVLTHKPEQTIAALMDAGADSIFYPAPSVGLTVHVTPGSGQAARPGQVIRSGPIVEG